VQRAGRSHKSSNRRSSVRPDGDSCRNG
jgi:hypothetical protein